MKSPKIATPPKPIAIPKETDEQINKKKKMQIQAIQKRSGRASTDYTGNVNTNNTQKMGG